MEYSPPGSSVPGILQARVMECVAIFFKGITHWKRLWCWEGLGAGGEGGDRGWDGWMASPTQWTWVWVNSGSWWWTGRPGVLRFMALQRVGHDWVTELNRTELMTSLYILSSVIFIFQSPSVFYIIFLQKHSLHTFSNFYLFCEEILNFKHFGKSEPHTQTRFMILYRTSFTELNSTTTL